MKTTRLVGLAARIPGHIKSFIRRFQDRGYECYLVGGAVRSLMLGNRPSDFDFATDATPEQVMDLFPRVIPTGIQHGTVTVRYRGASYEVTTYRTEDTYSDARRPDSVVFVGDIHEDLRRRDFTMNAMAFDPVNVRFLDPHDGVKDIRRKVIRAIGDPVLRFGEDALRMLRAVRFATQLEFSVDPDTVAAISDCAGLIRAVSGERIRDELIKLMAAHQPSSGLRLLAETGLLALLLPEVAEGIGVEQGGRHRFDVFEHAIRACDAAPADRPAVRLAALLHDAGKPRARVENTDGTVHFHRHEERSAEMAEQLLRRLKYPNRTITDVVHLVRHHMFNYTPEWTDAAVRRFIARVGSAAVPDLVALRAADSTAIRGERTDSRPLGEFSRRIKEHLAANQALTVRDLAVDGHDLIEAGIPRGPLMGVVLDALLETVLDDPATNTRQTLLRIAERFYEERLREPD